MGNLEKSLKNAMDIYVYLGLFVIIVLPCIVVPAYLLFQSWWGRLVVYAAAILSLLFLMALAYLAFFIHGRDKSVLGRLWLVCTWLLGCIQVMIALVIGFLMLLHGTLFIELMLHKLVEQGWPRPRSGKVMKAREPLLDEAEIAAFHDYAWRVPDMANWVDYARDEPERAPAAPPVSRRPAVVLPPIIAGKSPVTYHDGNEPDHDRYERIMGKRA